MSKKILGTAVLAIVLLAGLLYMPSIVMALFNNGNFEAGDFTGWTKTTFLNPGLSGSPPFDGSSIVRDPGGTDYSVVFGPFAAMSQTDPQTNNLLQYPPFGQYSARVNGPLGNGRNANSLYQQTTVAAGDLDPVTGEYHVRFVYAPVLEEPGHPAAQQAWMYIVVRNVTKSTILYQDFIFAGQPGLPWQQGPGQWQFVDWILVDLAPGAGNLDLGDTIEVEAIGAGCSPSAHAGYVHVDEFGPMIPGVTVVGSGPATTYQTQDITYTFLYRNAGAADANNTVVTIAVPDKTTFVSVSNPNCSHSAGTITCNFGTLAPGAHGTFDLVVNVNLGASGNVINGNYSIGATGAPTLLGPAIVTAIQPQAPTVTTIGSSVNPSVYGQGILLTANVSSGVSTPDGTVTFRANGVIIPGCANVPLVGGQATCNPGWLNAGQHAITAEYSGALNYLPSNGSLDQVVNKADTTTSLVSTANPSMYGELVSFTASVVANLPGGGIPGGTVSFYDGSTFLQTLPLDANGQATFTTVYPLAVGVHNIRAVYNGNENFNGSIGMLQQRVEWATDLTIEKNVVNPWLSEVTFVIVARNRACCCIAAPGAIISDTLAPYYFNATWTCEAAGGAQCGARTGTGSIYDTLGAFPPGGVVTYTLHTEYTLPEEGYIMNTAEIITPVGVSDIDMTNNRVTIKRYFLLLPVVLKDAVLGP